MNELKIFEHPKFGRIRTIVEDGKTLFCGLDAANALGYKDTTNAIKRHCRGVAKRHLTDNLGRIQETNFISEGDLCRLAAKSELPGANEFESWIFDEVIPAILRTGTYSVSPARPTRTPSLPDGVTFSSAVGFMRLTRRVMLDMGASPFDVGMMIKQTCEAISFPVPSALSRQLPGQTSLFDRPALEG